MSLFSSIHGRKLCFYARNIFCSVIPKLTWRLQLNHKIKLARKDLHKDSLSRVDYYLKLNTSFSLNSYARKLTELSVIDEPSGPTYDLISVLRYFSSNYKFLCDLKDKGRCLGGPTIVKCRPLSPNNENFVLLKLNSSRFFNFKSDKKQFRQKSNTAIFRGACHRQHRQDFIERCYGLPRTDIGDTRETVRGRDFHSNFTTRNEQLNHKFIISLEGNDVASNLPWVMASNSLAFMTKPNYEGWFMQGMLIPNHHYVLLRDDYSDLEEKIDYYSSNTEEALEIIDNANKHVAQFSDQNNELLISLLVLEKYFTLSGQIGSDKS